MRALSAQVFWTHAFGNSRPVAAAGRIEAGLLWNLLAHRR